MVTRAGERTQGYFSEVTAPDGYAWMYDARTNLTPGSRFSPSPTPLVPIVAARRLHKSR